MWIRPKWKPLVHPALIGWHEDGSPIFRVRAEARYQSEVDLHFQCPRCKAHIYHGGRWGKPGAGDGERAPHCNCWTRYHIKEMDDATPSALVKDIPGKCAR